MKSNVKKNKFVVSKMTRIWWILIRALKSLKNLHFFWSLLCKVYNVWSKKLQRSYLSWQWRVMQNLKKNWLVVNWRGKKDITNAVNFHQNTWKCQNWDPLVQNRWCMSLKFTGELCVMTMKNDTRLEEELTCRFKSDMRNLTNFDLSTWKSQKFAL